jgi:hypothetical protein
VPQLAVLAMVLKAIDALDAFQVTSSKLAKHSPINAIQIYSVKDITLKTNYGINAPPTAKHALMVLKTAAALVLIITITKKTFHLRLINVICISLMLIIILI